jgi:glycosyltransferase involved in cell wall biosynthesis
MCTEKDAMKILISAFACSPLWGSEPGVGWNWAVELAKTHDVVVLTHAYFRPHIDPVLADRLEINLRVSYLDVKPVFGEFYEQLLNSHLYYVHWQFSAARHVKEMLSRETFDLIHHLTWGTFRFPTFLGGLGVPLVMGPLGGGDRAPLRLYRSLPWKVRAFETIRLITLHLSRFEPCTVMGLSRAKVVLCKTEDTRSLLPCWIRTRAFIAPEIGAPAPALIKGTPSPSMSDRRLRLFFAGRLIGLKGISLAINAVKKLRDEGIPVELDIAGEGPLRSFLEQQIAQAELAGQVTLLGSVPRDRLMLLYEGADLFLFPSLHDSSGNVILESLSCGLPVVCLDLGGPKNYVNPDCGVVIATKNCDEEELGGAIASALKELVRDPERLQRMRAAAIEHACNQSWQNVVQQGYEIIMQHLE